jgi:hypothetical protein
MSLARRMADRARSLPGGMGDIMTPRALLTTIGATAVAFAVAIGAAAGSGSGADTSQSSRIAVVAFASPNRASTEEWFTDTSTKGPRRGSSNPAANDN